MDPLIKRVYQLLIISGLVTLFLIIALATPIAVNSSDFSIYNPGWNGCSNIAIKTYRTGKLQPTFYLQENELTLMHQSFAEYDVISNDSCIIIIGPRVTFSTEEVNYIEKFLLEGGVLFLADDFGTGNDLLKGINSTSRFSGNLILDLAFEKSANFVNVFNINNRSHELFFNVSQILLNYPTSIQTDNISQVLCYSSELSWVDKNLNGKEDIGETKGPFQVLAIEKFGKGKIVLLSDPSVLINSMKDQLDNKYFINNLIKFLTENRRTILIDESHRDISTPMQISFLFPRSIGIELKIGIILLVIFAFIFFFTKTPNYIFKKINQLIFKNTIEKKELSDNELIDNILDKHPNWNKSKLQEIIRRLE